MALIILSLVTTLVIFPDVCRELEEAVLPTETLVQSIHGTKSKKRKTSEVCVMANGFFSNLLREVLTKSFFSFQMSTC